MVGIVIYPDSFSLFFRLLMFPHNFYILTVFMSAVWFYCFQWCFIFYFTYSNLVVYYSHQTRAVKILHKHETHPYQLHQEFPDDDYALRIAFCEWAQHQIWGTDFFFNFVLFGGVWNYRNAHSQTKCSIKVWKSLWRSCHLHFFNGV